MTADDARESSLGRRFVWAGVLLLLVIVAYLPILRAGFIWDDDDYLVENATLRGPDALLRIWFEPRASPQYYPLVFTSFWVEYRLWELNPAGYHATNVLLHGAGAVLLWLVLVRLGVPGAWLAAALFAVHPVQVESVAWVTERKNVLSGLFYWAALLSYLRFAGVGEGHSKGWGWYAVSLGLFACALLSKTVTCTLPAILVLLLWWQRGLTRRDIVTLAPMFVLGVGMGLSTAFLEITHVGAVGRDYELGTVERVLLAGRALWFYLGKLVFPAQLTFIYPRWQIDSGDPWQYLFPAAAVALAGLLCWARARLGWGPLIAYLCFAGTLFPALGFFDIYPFRYSFVADHFQYLACAAPLAALAAFATLAARRASPAAGKLLAGLFGRSRQGPDVVPLGTSAARVLAGVLLIVLGGLTWSQTRAYRDLFTLFQDTLEKNPECWMAHNNLANLYMWRRQYSDAERQFHQCLELKPDHFRARRGLAQALIAQRRPAEAKAELLLAQAALEAQSRASMQDSQKQLLAQEYLEIGMLYESMGDDAPAERLYRAAIELKPDTPMMHFRLGNSLAKRSRFAEAIPHLRVMAEAFPDNAESHFFLAQALHAGGFEKEGVAQATEALRLAEAAGNLALRHAILQRFAAELGPLKNDAPTPP